MSIVRRTLTFVIVMLCVAMASLAFLTMTGRVRLQPVLTGSMAPDLPTGTLVAVSPVAATSLAVGDVVMFLPPPPYGTPTGGPVMHRIVEIKTDPAGHLALRTKGDANQVMDPWTLDGTTGGLTELRASSVAAGRAIRLLRSTAHGPAVLLWPGLLLLLVFSRRTKQEHYHPRHACVAPRRLAV